MLLFHKVVCCGLCMKEGGGGESDLAAEMLSKSYLEAFGGSVSVSIEIESQLLRY